MAKYSTDQKKKFSVLYCTWCVPHHAITVLSTTRSKLPRKCSYVTTALLPYFEHYIRNIGRGCE